ncbi:MAG: NADH-quinone oxidoreductase subunit C [Pelagibacteraceae bacterium]
MKSLDEVKTIIEGSPNFRFAKIEIQNDNLVCHCNADQLIDNVVQLKRHSDLKFRQLVDILAVDYPNREKRFEIIYLFLSHENNLRISIKIDLEDQQKIQTLTNVFPSANWLEREVFDMNGIEFSDHPDLRRILTDYNFEGFPLRKDFPLTGYKEVRYDPETKKVVYGPVKLQQAYRDFDFKSPWQGPDYIKKEQEKSGE